MSTALGNTAAAQIMLGELGHRRTDPDPRERRRWARRRGPDRVPAYLAALRGDLDTATTYAALPDSRASEDPQDRSFGLLADALIAAADHRPADALAHAREILGHDTALGLASAYYYVAWPTAARAAFELDDHDAVRELLARLDAHPIGHMPPLLRAERAFARARLPAARPPPSPMPSTNSAPSAAPTPSPTPCSTTPATASPPAPAKSTPSSTRPSRSPRHSAPNHLPHAPPPSASPQNRPQPDSRVARTGSIKIRPNPLAHRLLECASRGSRRIHLCACSGLGRSRENDG